MTEKPKPALVSTVSVNRTNPGELLEVPGPGAGSVIYLRVTPTDARNLVERGVVGRISYDDSLWPWTCISIRPDRMTRMGFKGFVRVVRLGHADLTEVQSQQVGVLEGWIATLKSYSAVDWARAKSFKVPAIRLWGMMRSEE